MNKQFFFTCYMMLTLHPVTLIPSQMVLAATQRVPSQFSTISKALDAADIGDTVKVAGGTYIEHIKLKDGVTLQGGWNGDFTNRNISTNETIIDGIKEKGPTVNGADNAVLDGFTVINGSLENKGESTQGSGIYCRGTSLTIVNNTIKNNSPSGVFCSDKSTAKIIKNRIHDNGQAGIFVQKGADIFIQFNTIWGNKYSGIGSSKPPLSKIIARNNIIYKNERSGINALFATGIIENNIIYENKRAGINGNATPLSIINNTIVKNGWAGILVEIPESEITIKNNIISENVEAGIRSIGQGVSYNLLFSNNDTGDCNPEHLWCVKAQYGGYGDEISFKRHKDFIANPQFIDAANNDYRLRGTSPAIDAGDPDSTYNDVNFPSSLGSEINDIGAFGGPQAIIEKAKANHAPLADSGSDYVLTSKKKSVILESG